ncbi:MAG: hypothetical protein DWQ18_03810 [Crenarchaeota archaeon]|nr:MAG: hypothetical protein DWQ17_09320 [Thermoproteota archaeon]RDJ34038.1 MAG: hypothetical protein DWQ18_03810 [Thermoproteota archaeon]RDJ36848.1 MAG: hypothetical protein DWQ13_06805 [Thermoproteota archaeon]RDJ37618.1 MAG: hypothetical protein DWQ19_04030 [Thermoproteota archaeon]
MSEVKKTKTSVTFRLDPNNLRILNEEAKKKEISLNTLANQIVSSYVDWHSAATQAGFVSLRKQLIKLLLEKYSGSEIMNIAEKVAADTTKDIVLLLRQKYNIETALNVIETWIRISNYPYSHIIDETKHTFVIQHDMGAKWSIYLSGLYKYVFESFQLKKVDFDYTEKSLSFEVDTTPPQ